jgi:hypothetical protein
MPGVRECVERVERTVGFEQYGFSLGQSNLPGSGHAEGDSLNCTSRLPKTICHCCWLKVFNIGER